MLSVHPASPSDCFSYCSCCDDDTERNTTETQIDWSPRKKKKKGSTKKENCLSRGTIFVNKNSYMQRLK